MKDLMINLFNKPKVLFMLMVICLGPPARTIQTIQACPPDCSDEEAAVAAAEDSLEIAKSILDLCYENLDRAYEALAKAQTAVDNAEKALTKANKILKARAGVAVGAGIALAAAIKKGNPLLIAAATLVWIGATIDLAVAEDHWKDANEALKGAKAAEKAAEEDVAYWGDLVDSAIEAVEAAEDYLAEKEAALAACEAG